MRRTQYTIRIESDIGQTEFKLYLDEKELKLVRLLERMSAKHGVNIEQPILYVDKTIYPVAV